MLFAMHGARGKNYSALVILDWIFHLFSDGSVMLSRMMVLCLLLLPILCHNYADQNRQNHAPLCQVSKKIEYASETC